MKDNTEKVPEKNVNSETVTIADDCLPSAPKLSRRLFLGTGAGAAVAATAGLLQPKAAIAAGGDGTGGGKGRGSGRGRNVGAAPTVTPSRGRYEPFNPTVMACALNGTVDIDIYADRKIFKYRTPAGVQKVPTRTYNHAVPGPSMIVEPGDTIKVNLQNNFPRRDPSDIGILNWPEGFNTTNIHFHGLHVSPSSYTLNGEKVLSSDDVLAPVDPRESHQWCVVLPDFHAPGTHWYHAHKHGSTGVQVSNGMAGAIIVRERNERLNIVGPMQDKIMLIQEVVPPDPVCATDSIEDLENNVISDAYDTSNLPDPRVRRLCDDMAVYSRGGTFGGGGATKGTVTPGDFLLNGIYQPTIDLASGQNQRWRFINATSTPRGNISLQLYKVPDGELYTLPGDYSDTSKYTLQPMWLIAVDGISFYGKRPHLVGAYDASNPAIPTDCRTPLATTTSDTWWEMASGNRADFIINLPRGKYHLIKLDKNNANPEVLAFVDVDRAPYQETIPCKVPGTLRRYPYLAPITCDELVNYKAATGKIAPRIIVFNRTPGGINPMDGYQIRKMIGPKAFYVNKDAVAGRTGLYDPDCVDITVDLGTAEEWELTNIGGADHPFHIHVNPFQIVGDLIDPDGPNDPSNWRWWDTKAVPRTNSNPPNPSTKIRNRFLDYDGEYVFHCHILIHEDQGMMVNVYVRDNNGEGIPPCFRLRKNKNGENVARPTREARRLIRQGAVVEPPTNKPDCVPIEFTADSSQFYCAVDSNVVCAD